MTQFVRWIEDFFRELRRRRVIRVAVVYAGTGVGLLELADILSSSLRLPSWTVRFVAVLLALGFPLAVGLTWVYDVTEEGIVRTGAEEEASPGEEGSREETISRDQSAPRPTTENSVAVLPFIDMSPDQNQAYLADGLADEVLSALSKVEGFQVAARTSSFAYRAEEVDVREIGTELGVEAVLEGSVRKAGPRIRVVAQLVDAEDGYHLWSKTYEREMEDLFEIQEEIARSVVKNLRGTLLDGEDSGEENRLAEKGTEDAKAHDLYLKGKYYWNHRIRSFGLENAEKYFRQAVEVDPDFALPHTGLADVYTMMAQYRRVPPAEVQQQTRAAIDRALELEPELAEAWHSEGLYRAIFEAEWEGAVSAFRRAAELDPSTGVYPAWIGLLSVYLGRGQEARRFLEKAEDLEPRSYYVLAVRSLAAIVDRRYDAAIRLGERALEIEERAFLGWLGKGVGLVHRGDHQEGIEALEQGAEAVRRSPYLLSMLGSAVALVGRKERARTILRELETRSGSEFVTPLWTGMLKGGLGRVEEALRDLKREREDHGAGAFILLGVSLWPELEGEPRYREMLREVGLGELLKR